MKQHKGKYWLEGLLDFGVIIDVASRASIILSKTIDIFFPIEEGRRTGGGREGGRRCTIAESAYTRSLAATTSKKLHI